MKSYPDMMAKGTRRWRRIRIWARVLLFVLMTLPPDASEALEVYGRSGGDLGLYAGSRLLYEWRVPEARRVVDEMIASGRADAGLAALEAHLLFFEGRYDASAALLQRIGLEGPFTDLVNRTRQATRGMRHRAGEHFIVSWQDPKDEVMVDLALATLEATRQALAARLGFEPDGPVRIEIYPDVDTFTAVSTLTREEVRTSGTIGLCKFDRLMITSPRATLWGYGWRDTLAHEYTHLAVYRLSAGTAPIWIHEGIAKTFERSWRSEEGRLDPSSEALLVRRLEADDLIPLEQMSPSVAKLPTAEDTKLAFAEVATMFRFLVERTGTPIIDYMLSELAAGRSDAEVMETVWHGGLAGFEKSWRAWIATQPFRTEATEIIALELKDEGDGEEPAHVGDRAAADFMRLGDLLRDRGRDRAAAAEYDKAYGRVPASAAVVSRRLWGRLALGDNTGALETAEKALALYPELPVLWYRKGSALLGAKRYDEAATAFEALLDINPFHLPGRRGLSAAARALGDNARIRREERMIGILEGTPEDAGERR